MKLRWSERAIRRLESIRSFIANDKPAAAIQVAASIVEAAYRLERFPLLGRAGKIEGTRELVVPGLPYVVAYRVIEDVILILSVLHTSRKWPEKL